ncbi:MAG TPA: hypothetical protein PKU68_05290 [Bacillota bacterium]|nr:hypothetical protein [Bacillota bacterium]
MFVATATEILPLFLYYIVKHKLCNEKPMNMMTRGKAKRNEGDSLPEHNTKMKARNNREETLEFFVVKAPSPKMFPKESQIGR